eukprot:4712696-Amphidinium_carterae.1
MGRRVLCHSYILRAQITVDDLNRTRRLAMTYSYYTYWHTAAREHWQATQYVTQAKFQVDNLEAVNLTSWHERKFTFEAHRVAKAIPRAPTPRMCNSCCNAQ